MKMRAIPATTSETARNRVSQKAPETGMVIRRPPATM